MERDSFVFYSSFLKAIRAIKKRDIQAELALAIIEYGITGETAECGETVSMAMELIKPQLEANNQKYINGLKGGAPKGNQNAKKEKEQPKNNQETTEEQPKNNQKQPKNNQKQPNENVNENDNVNEEEKKYIKKEKSFKEFTEQDFKEELKLHSEKYSKEMLKDFFIYWTEPNEKGKMKFQLQKTWSTAGRLSTWSRNDFNGNSGSKQKETKQSGGHIARDGTRITMF